MAYEAMVGLQKFQAGEGGGFGDEILPDGVSWGAVG